MLTLICWLIFIVVAIPLGIFVIECICSVFYKAPIVHEEQFHTNSSVILIPAHNEEQVIRNTLNTIIPQLADSDRVLVIADNCSDSTADIVRELGCDVTERFHETDRGKGFALSHGLEVLTPNPPDVVIIVDADCQVQPGAIARIKAATLQFQKPVQARYLLQSPEGAGIKTKVSEFAVFIKNKIRTKGLSVLGAPIPLLGSGMGFLWRDVTSVSLASGEIVEDMKLGIELADQGQGSLYDDGAVVLSELPVTEAALAKQRERWEHGHMGMIQKFALPLIKNSLARTNPKLLLFGLDLAVPPLSLLLMFAVGVFLFFAFMQIFIDLHGLLSAVAWLVFAVISSVFIVWLLAAQHILKPSELIHIPLYVLSKLGVYKGFVEKKQTTWNRTDRH